MMRFQRSLAIVFAICFAHATLIQTAHAALLTTEQAARAEVRADDTASGHSRLAAALARADVQTEMQRLGIDADQATARIAALTDEEAARLADQIDSAPAGAGVIGALLLVFFVLLLTDILGFTKIFPFTRSVR